jgi:hypothetical protein
MSDWLVPAGEVMSDWLVPAGRPLVTRSGVPGLRAGAHFK